MADEPDSAVLAVLKKVQASIGKLERRTSDMQNDVQTMQRDISIIRGDTAAMRHDLNRVIERYYDLDVRVSGLEGNERA